MTEQIPVSQYFQTDPRGWTTTMIDKLMKPGVRLTPYCRTYATRTRAKLAKDADFRPGPSMYERLCRIAKACGVLPRRRRIPRVEERPVNVPARPVPKPFRLGEPIPDPPPLRRPFVMLGESATETWDPAGMPGL